MASVTVRVPQGFPVGTTLGAYVDRVGDISPQGAIPISTAVIQTDGRITVTGIVPGIPYQVGAVINGVWRSFLVESVVLEGSDDPNVRDDFGAKGDGVTNDTEALQDALDAAGPGGAIVIPYSPLPYLYETLRFYSNQTIRGAGQRRSELRQINGVADILLGPSDPAAGYKYLLIEDLYLNAQVNPSNTGGLLLEGVQHSDVSRVQVGSTNGYAFRVLGKGAASSGDAMFNRFNNCYGSNMVSGYGWQISPAPGGGSHPDATRLFGCDVIGSVGTAFRIDPASADTAGFLAADAATFIGCTAQQMPVVFDIRGGQGHKIMAGRYERTGSAGTTMTVNIAADTPTNNPTRAVLFEANEWATHGVAADLVWNDTTVGGVERRSEYIAGSRSVNTYPAMAASEAVNGSVFLDSADGILKHKNAAGAASPFYGEGGANVDSFLPIAAGVAEAIELAVTAATSAKTARGTIRFTPAKVYTLNRPVLLDRNHVGLTIDHQWARLLLSSSAPRAYDWNKVADYDTFQYVTFKNSIVDVNNVGGKHHCLTGIWQNGSHQLRINMNEIHVDGLRILNSPVGTNAAVDFRVGVYIGGGASDVDTLTTFTNCSVKNIWSDGCLQLVAIHSPPVAPAKWANCYHDNILVENWRHELPTTPTAFNNGGHIMAGTKGNGGKITIRNGFGKNSPDVGIECDGFQDALMEDVTIEDAWGADLYHVNYAPAPNPEAQLMTLNNFVARRRNIVDRGSGFSAAFGQSQSITGAAATDIITTGSSHGYVNGDEIALYNITGGAGLTGTTRYFVISATTSTFQLAATAGGAAIDFTTDLTAGTALPLKNKPGAIHFGPGCQYHRMASSTGFTTSNEALTVNGARRISGELECVLEYPDYSTGTDVFPRPCLIRNSDLAYRMAVDLKLRIRAKCNVTGAGAGHFHWSAVLLQDGLITNFDMDVRSQVDFPGAGASAILFSDCGAGFATSAPAVISGRWRVVVPATVGGCGTSPEGIRFETGALNTVPNNEEILLEDCNFAGLPTLVNNVRYVGTSLGGKVRYVNNNWRDFPQARRTITTNTTLDGRADLVGVADTSAVRVHTLPLAASVPPGRRISFKDETGGAATNPPQFLRNGSDTIDGGTAAKTIPTNYGSFDAYSDGVSKWLTV